MAQGDTLGVVMQSDIGSGASGGVAAQAQISGVFSASASYAVGAYVVQSGLLYRCTTPHSGAWNAAHFEQVTIGGELNTRTPVYGMGVNLLDNWYFVGGGSQQGGGKFPINQRGQTSYTGSGRKFDRWGFGSMGGDVNLVASGASVKVTSSNQSFSQNMDIDPTLLLGKTVTASALVIVSSVVTLYTITAQLPTTMPTSSTTYASTSIPGLGSFTIGWANSVSRFAVSFANSSASSGFVTIVAVKLEFGTQQTLAHQDAGGNWVLNDPPPNFQQELAKCQRYFQVFRDQNLRPAYGMDYRPPMAKEQPTQSSFVLDDVTYYTASAEL